MRIAELIHDADHLEALSNVDLWAARIGAETKRFYACRGEYPRLSEVNLLILHGGAQHLWDKDKDPWLIEELDYVKRAAVAGIPVIGFCLGSQIIAEAFGGRVYRSDWPECGMYPVVPYDGTYGHPLLKGLENGFNTFLWHEDHFDLPPGFSSLAYTTAAPNQITAGDTIPVIGIQAHPEYTKENIEQYLQAECSDSWRTENGIVNKNDFIRYFSQVDETYSLFETLMRNALKWCIERCAQ